MRIIIYSILAIVAVAIPIKAQEPTEKDSLESIAFVIQDKRDKIIPKRAPMHVCIEAYYEMISNTLTVSYDGNSSGEVFLYMDGNIVGYNTNINTSFQIYESGLYTIKIVSETWTAYGYLQLSNNQ